MSSCPPSRLSLRRRRPSRAAPQRLPSKVAEIGIFTRTKPLDATPEEGGVQWLVVGLGNPGADYAGNRHNVGQMVLAELADRRSTSFRSHKANAMVAEARTGIGGPRLVLAKPNSFMNVSGGPVAALLRFYKIPAERLIVVHDELDIPFDSVRLKRGGGHGGHNGLRDIISAIGTPEFLRVRVGIGRPPGRQPAADFVLRDFASTERAVLPNLLADAADAVESLATEGLTAAQQRFHAPT